MYSTVIEPRVSETDGVGHINNTVLPVWFEAGRHDIFKLFNPDNSFENWRMVIINTNIHYKQQIFFGEDVMVKVWVKRIGNSSLELYEEIWQNDHCCATSNTVYVNFDKDSETTERIPEDVRAELMKHLYKGEETFE